MLTYSFSNIGSVPLYQHLYKCIKNDIIEQILAVGEKLPSKRNFAKNLGISIITVENAYEQLIAEGYIYSLPKKGYFVADIKNVQHSKRETLVEKSVEILEKQPKYFVDFTSNQTDSENFPFSIWAKLIREILNDNQKELVTNPPCGGILELREAIAKHLKDFRDLHVEPEQIIIGAGTEYLYGLLIQLLGFDKRYAVEDPGYNKISKIYKKHEVACDYISLDDCGVRIDELENCKTDVIHISPSHHFPTGKIMPIGRRYELLGWASKEDSRYIIEDDYDSEFRMVGKPIPAMQNIDVLEKVIYINTFTKTLASTVRISYMVLPKHLVTKFYSELSFYSCTVSNFEQYTLAKFVQDGYFEKHINRMRNYYHTKRDRFVTEIENSPIASYVKIMEENSGLHFIMKMDMKMKDEAFCFEAKKKGIKIMALSSFYSKTPENVEHYYVVNYSSVAEENMKEAIRRIHEILS